MAKPAVGVIGLGRMGSSIATRLATSGYSVTGYDADNETVRNVTDGDVRRGESTDCVAAEADVIITSLPTPAVVEAVYLGDDGIDAGATRGDGVVALEMSTIEPDTTRRIAAKSDGVELLDAPVSGGPSNCSDGSLVTIVGGDEDVYQLDAVQELLECLSDRTFYAGEVGAGHTVKLLNNVLSMGNLLLAMEAASLGVAAGVDGKVLEDILTNTGGASNQLRKRLPKALNRNFEAGFTVDYARKDTGLALEMGNNQEMPLMLTALVNQLYTRASAEGLGDEDCCSVVKLFEQSTGVPVESERYVDETFDGYVR
ncbi:NAD(P)-dependent oxidoreductase [Salinadaptatus halalkaliphilus]|uniref:NAD(P)-dependent oxidoreductase n=1 Tax=Salinadaptatus halalkaliphilus TaxID=2419781 RepID=A0A4S3TQS7_9EURY|nr:NAD(P)-dependent oxidoreductase [Salinadaptatus halalkaliphilus]THE65615.1 NAD(P)-dependent oxidoreductase [Salinadaptatus halalkaliphilus]